MSKRFLKKFVIVGSALPVAIMAQSAHAAVDITAATAGISDAGVAILAIVGALLALSVSVYGLVKVLNFMSKKSGA